MSSDAVKVGTWGGSNGTPRDIGRNSKPQRLESITIYSTEAEGGRVYGLSFEYLDQMQQNISVGPFGTSSKGNEETIPLGQSDYVYRISGTTDSVGVKSLRFETSKGMVYGPYGFQSGKDSGFSLPLDQDQGKVVAFFGRSRDSLIALGVYVLPAGDSIKIGPWGARGGTPRNPPTNQPHRLINITINSSEGAGERIYGLSFEYLDKSGQTITVGPWGSTKGYANTITLANREYVNHISGTTDDKGVTSMNVETTMGAKYGTYGSPAGTSFSLPMNQGDGTTLSFFGLATGNCLVALGTFLGKRA